MNVKLNTGHSIKVKEGTSIIIHVPRVTEGVLYVRFYADDDRLIETQVVNVAEVAPDETLKPLPVRYRDPETNDVIAQNAAADVQDATPKHEHETDPEGRQICTTSGEAPSKVRAEQTEATGQHKGYIVLCEAERQKGFVRPYRDAYKHVGRSVCLRHRAASDGFLTVCGDVAGHAGECFIVTRTMGPNERQQAEERGRRLGGCGSVTTMGRALSETYARDPKFYGATFCVSCNKHLPVAEFVWTADGQEVGS